MVAVFNFKISNFDIYSARNMNLSFKISIELLGMLPITVDR